MSLDLVEAARIHGLVDVRMDDYQISQMDGMDGWQGSTLMSAHEKSWSSGWANLEPTEDFPILQDGFVEGSLVHFYYCPAGDRNAAANFRRQAQLMVIDTIRPPSRPSSTREHATSQSGSSLSGSSTPTETSYWHYRPPTAVVAFWEDDSGSWLVLKEAEGDELPLLQVWAELVQQNEAPSTGPDVEERSDDIAEDQPDSTHTAVDWGKVCELLLQIVRALQALNRRRLALVWTHPSCFTVKNGCVYIGRLEKVAATSQFSLDNLSADPINLSSLFKDDFRFASSELNSRFICCHLRYLSPESALTRQINPMNDIYGWGVLAYELLTGTTIDGNTDDTDGIDVDILEGVHRHVTSEIPSPLVLIQERTRHMFSVLGLGPPPSQLSDIVMLALSKNFDERYHSFDTLAYDLKKLSQVCRSNGDPTKFTPGQVDRISRFKFPTFVIERSSEFEQLDNAFRAVKFSDLAPTTRVLNVWGVSGVGKTRLVDEWARRLEASDADAVVVARCKTDQLSNKPLTSFVQIFQSLLDQILTRPKEEPAKWRQLIKSTLGSQYGVLVSLLPRDSRRLLQEDESSNNDVVGVDLENFLAAFKYWAKRFLQLFASRERPLIILVDDAQWMIEDEVALWKHLLDSESPLEHVLVISMTRTNESTPPTTLSVTSTPINIKKLTEEGVGHYVSACFSNRLESASQGVYSLIYGQTGGSPFFLRTLLSQLVKEEVVVFDHSSLEWRFDVGELHGRLEAKEVDHFLDRMLNALPPDVQKLLKTLSCLPISGFSIKHLAALLNKTQSELLVLIDVAASTGAVVKSQGHVKFTHDRQQSAAARLIPKEESPELHQQVSFFLRRPVFISDYLFEACDHALLARHLGAPKEPEEQLVSLVIESAKRAALTTSFSLASKWVHDAEDIISESGSVDLWLRQHPQLFLRYVEVGVEIACVTKQYEWGLSQAEEILSKCQTVVHKLRVVCLIIRLLFAANRPSDAAERAFALFRELGYDLEHPKKIEIWKPAGVSEVEELQETLIKSELLPDDDELHLLMTLCCSAGPPVFFIRSPLTYNLFALGISLVKAAGRLSTACAYLIGAYPVVCSRMLTDVPVKRALYRLSVEACKKLPNSKWTSHELYVCVANGWLFHPFHEIQNIFPTNFEQTISLGDGDFASYILMVELPVRAFSKTPCDLPLLVKRYSQIKPFFSLSNRLCVHPSFQYLEGRLSESPIDSLMDGYFTTRKEMEENPQLGYQNGLFGMYELRLLVWYDAPLQFQIEKAQAGSQWDDGVAGFPPQAELAFLRSIINIRASKETNTIEETLTMFRQYTEWNSSFTMRIAFLEALQRLHADPLKSLLFVEKTTDLLQAAEENELCGLLNFYTAIELAEATGSERIAVGYIQRAFAQYEAAQGYGYLQMLKRRFPGVCPDLPAAPELPSTALGYNVQPPRTVSQKPAAPTKMISPEHQSTLNDVKTETDLSSASSESSIDSLTLMKSSLTLAQEKDSAVLLCTLLRILCQNVRCDFAAIGLCEDENPSSIKLVAAGPFKRISPFNLDLAAEEATTRCPSSIMLHVQRTGVPITSFSKLEGLRPDPYYRGGLPRTLICLPITNQGAQAGVILLSSKTVIPSQSDSSKEVISIISTLATFACVTYSHHQFSSRLAKTVEERTRELRSALQTKAMFLSQCSHELRSPLGAMMGLATVLEASPGLTEVQREHLRTINSSGEDLLALISNILDHAKLESNSVTLEELPMNLLEVVETALDTIAPAAQAKGVEVALTTPFEFSPPGLIGDPFRTKQVLLNLLSNAVKFTPPPSASRPNQSVIVSWTWKETDGMISVSIQVTDTGVGIPDQKLHKLFRSFSQVDESITRSYGGSGLGLVISRDLARLLGGDCEVTSEFGKGSTFTFTFVAPPDPKWKRLQINRFALPRSTFVVCSKTNAWVERLVKDLEYINCSPVVVAENLDNLLVDGHADGLKNNGRSFDFIVIDTSLTKDSTFEQIKQCQPHARFVFISRAVDLAAEIGRLQISRECIVSRPIKFEALYHAIRPRTPSPQPLSGVKGADKLPAKKKFDKTMGQQMPLRILLVDDSAVNIEVCRRLLELYGYKDIEAASDGLQAVEAAERKLYDLILLDLQMPVMDGYDAFERIKASPLAGDPSCVSLSANADKKAIEKCTAVGFFEICTKPIRTEKLRDILMKAYQHRKEMKTLRAIPPTGPSGYPGKDEEDNEGDGESEMEGKRRRDRVDDIDEDNRLRKKKNL